MISLVWCYLSHCFPKPSSCFCPLPNGGILATDSCCRTPPSSFMFHTYAYFIRHHLPITRFIINVQISQVSHSFRSQAWHVTPKPKPSLRLLSSLLVSSNRLLTTNTNTNTATANQTTSMPVIIKAEPVPEGVWRLLCAMQLHPARDIGKQGVLPMPRKAHQPQKPLQMPLE
ncbi:hypothetical protein MLD38_034376 [Melastoma candidum]|uniref:Uncharacterized protein n=1 Tax=Melastoma candidum TaxID=119954 RepID=A0ACB9MC20_9MYRT|nr:hypothetical protein MLD38_034376 [Melastoma candidum]